MRTITLRVAARSLYHSNSIHRLQGTMHRASILGEEDAQVSMAPSVRRGPYRLWEDQDQVMVGAFNHKVAGGPRLVLVGSRVNRR